MLLAIAGIYSCFESKTNLLATFT